MIWRLEYENAHGDVARLDIQRGAATPVEIIEGTENPFLLSYELEDKNKKGFIMSSFADISIYETDTFNIDDLKTLDETALSVKWYINSVLEWTGFVVPDFFSRTIGEPAIVNLAASDRLSSLEDATLDGLSEYVKIKDLAIACLAKTGLSLPLITTVDFKADNVTNIMDVFALSERLEDDKGKKISCFDVLRSILVLTNSTIRQRKGQWRLYNKIQHEAVSPTLNFNEVYQGAKRTIQPVFSSVGAFQEFGGERRYPFNYDFQLATGWTAKNGFSFIRDNREVLGYTAGTIFDKNRVPVFGDPTDNYQLVNNNDIFTFRPTDIIGSPYLESSKMEIPYSLSKVNINLSLRASTTRTSFYFQSGFPYGTYINFAVIAESASETLIMNKNGAFVPIGNNANNFQRVEYKFTDPGTGDLITKETAFNGVLDVDGLVSDYKIIVRIYGSGGDTTTLIDSLSYSFSLDQDNGKGILYRTDQLGNFSKKNDPDTTIFGDLILRGLNGYFYPFAEDDTSVLRAPSGSNLPLSKWATATDPTAGELPILQHVTRQMSRMFGVAHNILSAVIDAKTFDPLAIVTNCAGEKYVIVAATFDFLRSTVEVELQQIAYGSLLRRDFIFSYFGGGDGDGISSIGSVSGGGSSSGGGGGGIPQTLDLIADELFISGGNSVDLGVYARKTWVETEATAYNSARLGGQLASKYTRRDVAEVVTGGWTFRAGEKHLVNIVSDIADTAVERISGIKIGRVSTQNTHHWEVFTRSVNVWSEYPDFHLDLIGHLETARYSALKISGKAGSRAYVGIGLPVGDYPTERLHVVGNGLFEGNLTAGGNVGTSNFVSQMMGWRVTPQGQADFRHIYTDELQAKAFTADISQALVGSDVLTKSVAKLAQNWATTANGATSTIYVEELEGFPDFQVFAVGDRLLLRLFDRAGGGLLIKNIWATVASYVSTTKNVQRYTITVNSGGATGQTVYAGSMVLDYGTPGSGVIERTVLDQQGSPYSRVSTWVNNPWTPGNYTLHYQSGNLNGIANANGWGVYSENSFLTGKLLVGDLTKQGQFMEYANGQLNIKGKITVTGGNAATKADVDAGTTAAETSAKDYADGVAAAAETAAKTFATAEAAAVQVGGRNLLKWTNTGANWDKTAFDKETLIFTRETTGTTERFIYLANKTDLEKNTTYTLSAWVRTNGQVKGVDFFCYDKSGSNSHSKRDMDIGTEWQFITFTFTTNNADYSESTIRFDNNGSKTAGVNAILYIKKPKLELGNRATDWTPAPEDVPSALEYLATALVGDTNIAGGLVTTNLLMVKDSMGIVKGGMSGLNDNIGFWTGGSYQGAITNNANVIFRKDGSFSLAGGKIIGTSAGAAIIEGGLITGMIESSNYDGEKGSRFDLHNGHLVIGDAIWMSGDTSEIQVRDRNTGLDTFKIGDFPLSPTYFAGVGVDVLLSSSSITASPAAGSYQLNRTVYVSGSGVLTTSLAYISYSLIAGGTYNFQTKLKVVLTQGTHIETVPGYIMSEGFYRRSGGIKIQLKNYNTVVWEQNISTIPANGVILLLISTSFQAVSPQLQLIITIDGEFEYRQPYDSGTRLYNTTAYIERFNSSSRLVLRALTSRMEFSTKGMQAVFSDSNYFRCDSTRIEGRGTQTFISPDGRYRLRVSNNGIEKSVNYGEVWTAL